MFTFIDVSYHIKFRIVKLLNIFDVQQGVWSDSVSQYIAGILSLSSDLV